MYLIKFNPLTALAVQWKGNNIEEIVSLIGNDIQIDSNKTLSFYLRNAGEAQVPLNYFILRFYGTFFILTSEEFHVLCENYLFDDNDNTITNKDELENIQQNNKLYLESVHY